MSPPKAKVHHSTPGRIRIKVHEKRGNHPYFNALAESLSMLEGIESLEVTPHTASALVTGQGVSVESLAKLGEKEGLFFLEELAEGMTPAQAAAEPIRQLNRKISEFTGGQVELATLGFFALLGTGAYQLIRGNFRLPPWYSAFWYAFGLFTKEIIAREKTNSRRF